MSLVASASGFGVAALLVVLGGILILAGFSSEFVAWFVGQFGIAGPSGGLAIILGIACIALGVFLAKSGDG